MKTIIIVITGIPGAGKTTLLKEMLKVGTRIKVINYGDAMLEIAAGQQIERDVLRKLPIPEQQAIELLAAKKISGEAEGITFIDTHALIKTPVGYFPGIPKRILQVLNPSAIVAIEADPSIILERRKKDRTRFRDKDSVEEIEYHQQLSRSFISACSAMEGIIIIPLQNEAEPSVAVNHLMKALKFFEV